LPALRAKKEGGFFAASPQEKKKDKKTDTVWWSGGLAQVGGVAGFSFSVQVFPPTCAKPLALDKSTIKKELPAKRKK